MSPRDGMMVLVHMRFVLPLVLLGVVRVEVARVRVGVVEQGWMRGAERIFVCCRRGCGCCDGLCHLVQDERKMR